MKRNTRKGSEAQPRNRSSKAAILRHSSQLLCRPPLPRGVSNRGPGGERGDLEEAEHRGGHRPEARGVIHAEEQAAHDGEQVNHQKQQHHNVGPAKPQSN